jgi:hypothetical protein
MKRCVPSSGEQLLFSAFATSKLQMREGRFYEDVSRSGRFRFTSWPGRTA